MSTAVLISGQLRTFAQCWPAQRWHVLRHFADPHFFICVQDDPYLDSKLSALIAEYSAARVHIHDGPDPDLSAQLTPALSAAYHRAPYANAAPAHQLLLQHWYQNEVWKFFQKEIADCGSRVADSLIRNPKSEIRNWSTIIRLRADLWFHSFTDPISPIRPISPTECFTPWWGRFGGINDRFAILGPEAARAYFTTYEHIPELIAAGCPFHPESLVAASLARSAITVHDILRTEFSTLRASGEQRWPEISPIDIAHAALRAA